MNTAEVCEQLEDHLNRVFLWGEMSAATRYRAAVEATAWLEDYFPLEDLPPFVIDYVYSFAILGWVIKVNFGKIS